MPESKNMRLVRIAEVIRQELGNALLTRSKDPRLEYVNLTRVRVSRDLSIARVNYLIIGLEDPESRKGKRLREETQQALQRAQSYLRREVGQNIELRVTPRLVFHWDSGIEHGRRMAGIFSEIEEERRQRSKDAPTTGDKEDAS